MNWFSVFWVSFIRFTVCVCVCAYLPLSFSLYVFSVLLLRTNYKFQCCNKRRHFSWKLLRLCDDGISTNVKRHDAKTLRHIDRGRETTTTTTTVDDGRLWERRFAAGLRMTQSEKLNGILETMFIHLWICNVNILESSLQSNKVIVNVHFLEWS